ncbi:predicted protein [Nematostella vectensis]|uniref:Protein kinase domain-containing protein n=1 Tax=Nematostella vectensis TaxID=45351 RepID=A7SRN4_NEMVE|nr:testis-specific serine/threonine-protein kinase 3 [Nematostella vectensis]EDO33625.1 predicted protein [Nematostella vectensis]|eukprot:XP_001625725.1 predicted protein [Nematostella vectensis]
MSSAPPEASNDSSKNAAVKSEAKAKQTPDNKRPKSGAKSSKSTESTAPFDTAIPVLSAYGYALGDTLGKGSYAVVKAAYSRKLKKQVAVKIVTKKKAPDDYLTKFLPREIQVMKHLNHSNVVSLHEAIETSSRIYIILDLADNGDLLEYIRSNGAIPENEARLFYHQLVDAVEYLHNKGVVHRDLKCENILLNRDNRILISDFGFARTQHVMADTGKRRLSQTFCGSYAYAPPEILRGIAYDGTLADIWSLGVVLYTMVSASLPFDDTNLKVLLEQVSRDVVFSRRKKISDEVKDLVRRMLVADVKTRIDLASIRRHPWFVGTKFSDAAKIDEVPQHEISKSKQEAQDSGQSSGKSSGDSGIAKDETS